jgi:alpha-tubulin suppressor-like RCC1 family protein
MERTTRRAQAFIWRGAAVLGVLVGSQACGDDPVAPGSVAEPALAAGGAFTCRLTTEGEAECWGLNSWGQLGAESGEVCGTEPCVRRPTPVASALRFRSLSASTASSRWSGHVCGVTTAGEGYCWGVDKTQLGQELDSPEYCVAENGLVGQPCSRTPVRVPIDGRLLGIASGDFHSCGVTDGGAVWCWGSDSNGQLGTTESEICTRDLPCSYTPVRIAMTLRFVQVVSGSLHSCALVSSGKAYCWGNNDNGQLGMAGHLAGNVPPVAAAGGLVFTRLAAGWRHTCGLTGSGEIYCWGDNSGAQLGNGSIGPAALETRVRTGLRFTAVSAGWFHTCALAADGRAYCWGSDDNGQLGTALAEPASCGALGPCSPIPVAVGGGRRYVAIGAGGAHTCALATDGVTYCWGDNRFGQLGDGASSGSATPVRLGS